MWEFKQTVAPKRSPWGTVDDAQELAPGIWQVETPGHGGVKLSAERMKAMPDYLKHDGRYSPPNWFEEDCDWALVALAYPAAFPEYREQAVQVAQRYHPKAYAAYMTCETSAAVKAAASLGQFLGGTQ